MEIKDVLSVVDHTKESENAFRYAAQLATRHKADLFVSCPIPEVPPILYMATQFNRDWLEVLVEQFKSEEGRLFEHYTNIGTEMGVDFEWWSEQGDPQGIVLDHSRIVDLIVASKSLDSDHLVGLSGAPAAFLLESKTPVIIVPEKAEKQPLPSRVIVAWDESCTAAKAIRQALPLLRVADFVQLLTVGELSRSNPVDDHATMAAYLDRHGVVVESKTVKLGKSAEHEILMSEINASNIDLLVMGAYGHARIRELILGGMTRKILQAMTVPVFMTH